MPTSSFEQHEPLNLSIANSQIIMWVNLNIQVERYSLDRVLVKGTVEHVTPVMEEENDWTQEQEAKDELRVTERNGDGSRKRVKYFQVQLQEGLVLKARQVVMATGPTRAQMANIPSWVKSIGESYPEERLQHTVRLMHCLTTARQQLQDGQRESETFLTQGETPLLCKITIIQKKLCMETVYSGCQNECLQCDFCKLWICYNFRILHAQYSNVFHIHMFSDTALFMIRLGLGTKKHLVRIRKTSFFAYLVLSPPTAVKCPDIKLEYHKYWTNLLSSNLIAWVSVS